jgi:hypothetical protein
VPYKKGVGATGSRHEVHCRHHPNPNPIPRAALPAAGSSSPLLPFFTAHRCPSADLHRRTCDQHRWYVPSPNSHSPSLSLPTHTISTTNTKETPLIYTYMITVSSRHSQSCGSVPPVRCVTVPHNPFLLVVITTEYYYCSVLHDDHYEKDIQLFHCVCVFQDEDGCVSPAQNIGCTVTFSH